MSFNSVGQYTATHKVWDHVGNIVPDVELSEGFRPGPFKVATWLPVQMFDKYDEDWYVIMPGKGVALDHTGRVVPAGLAVSGATISYTANDVAAGVIDVTTGEAVTGVKTVTISDVDGSTSHFLGQTGTALSISKFIGFAPYPYVQWAGDGSSSDTGFNPSAYRQHNYNKQHGVAVNCDYLIEVPLVPVVVSSAEALTFGAPSANVATADAVANIPVAANTVRTPMTFSGTNSSLFVVQKDTLAEVTQSGDWHIDLTTGVVSVYSASVTPTVSLTYYYYDDAAAPTPVGSDASRFACAVGDLAPGDFVKFNVDSNYIKADPSSDNFDVICGQIVALEEYPRGGLDKVKTAWSPAIGSTANAALPGYSGQLDQMPGTATGGVSDKIHFAGAANTVAHINIISR